MKRATILLLALFATVPALAAEWELQGPIDGGDVSFCIAISEQNLAIRNNSSASSFDLALFNVPVGDVTLIDLEQPEAKTLRSLLSVDDAYTANLNATLTPLREQPDGTPTVDVYMTSADFHLYRAIKDGAQLRAIVGEGMPFSLDIDTAPGTILSYSLEGSRFALEWTETCGTGAQGAGNAVAPDTDTPETTTSGPSFDCDFARSTPEKIICADPELAALDQQLHGLYLAARQVAETTELIGDDPQSPVAWFDANNKAEWTWREENCADKACLVRWYGKRRALLRWLAEPGPGFGDGGIKDVVQIDDGSVLISYAMAAYRGNVLWEASTDAFLELADGDITVLSTDPLLYRVDWKKAYWKDGGAYWFSSIRDADNRIIAIPPFGQNEQCMPFAEFLDKSGYDAEALAALNQPTVCVYN